MFTGLKYLKRCLKNSKYFIFTACHILWITSISAFPTATLQCAHSLHCILHCLLIRDNVKQIDFLTSNYQMLASLMSVLFRGLCLYNILLELC